jgi:hypothetical protein
MGCLSQKRESSKSLGEVGAKNLEMGEEELNVSDGQWRASVTEEE